MVVLEEEPKVGAVELDLSILKVEGKAFKEEYAKVEGDVGAEISNLQCPKLAHHGF